MTSDRKPVFEHLVIGHFDGTLSEAEERELAELLVASDEAKELFASHMRLEGRLHSLGRDGLLREPSSVPKADSEAVQPVAQQSRFRSLRMPLIVSTAVLLAMSFRVFWPASVDAAEVLQEARQAAAEQVDRTYRLMDVRGDGDGVSIVRDLKITLRGGRRFVLQPQSGAYVMGSDGQEYWMARPDGPVFVTRDFAGLAHELKHRMPNRRLLDDVINSPDEPLLLDISGLLKLIEDRYAIELIESPQTTEYRLQATRRRGLRTGPSMITFHVDSDSGVVLRVSMSFGRSGSRRRTLELIDTPTLSDGWYHHSQHAPERQVERLD